MGAGLSGDRQTASPGIGYLLYSLRAGHVENMQPAVHILGDIDYPALAEYLLKIGVKPLLVLEQAVEAGSPNTLKAVEAFTQSTRYTRRLFAGFAS